MIAVLSTTNALCCDNYVIPHRSVCRAPTVVCIFLRAISFDLADRAMGNFSNIFLYVYIYMFVAFIFDV